MAGLDAGIYSQIQPTQTAPNQLAQIAQIAQIQRYQQDGEKDRRALEMQDKRQAVLSSDAFRNATPQQQGQMVLSTGDVEGYGKLTTANAAASKDTRAAAETDLKMAIQQREALGGALMQAADNPQMAPTLIKQLVDQRIIDPAYGQKILDDAGKQPDARRFFGAGALASMKAMDQMSQQIQRQGQAVTMRGQDMTAQTAAAGQNVTMRGQNMTDERSRDANEMGRIPSGFRRTEDGNLVFIPGGPADPAAAKKASPTEFQGKSASFGSRAQAADQILNGIGSDYSAAGVNAKTAAAGVPLVGGVLEAGANTLLGDNSQKVEQAQRDFVNAVLRQESGAAIGKDEFSNAKRQYFAQPGDSKAVIEQKAANRKLVIEGFRNNAGTAVMGGGAAPPTAAAPKAPAAAKADVGGMEAELRRRGLL